MLKKLISKIGKDLLGNSFWLLLDKVMRLCVGLVVGVLVARHLGPEKMGIWNYGLAIFAFFSVFPSLGLEYVTPRELVLNKDKPGAVLSSVWLLKFLGSIAGIVLSSLFIVLFKGADSTLFYFVFLLTLGYVFQSLDVVEYYLQSRLIQKHSVIAKMICYLIIAGYKYYLITSDADLSWFVASSTIEFLLVAISFYIIYRRLESDLVIEKPNGAIMKKMLRDSVPFSFSALVIVLHYKVDQIMIAEMLGEFENGIFSVSARVFELFVFVPSALTASFLPILTANFNRDDKEFVTSLKHLYSILTYAAVIFTIGVWFLGPLFMQLMYGDKFDGSGEVLKILGLCLYPTFLGVATGSYLIVRNLKKVNFLRSIAGLLVSLSLNLLLIPRFGIVGAAITSIASTAASTFFIVFVKDNHKHLSLFFAAFNIASIRRFIKYR